MCTKARLIQCWSIRTQLAAYLPEDLKTLGIHRQVKTQSLNDILSESDNTRDNDDDKGGLEFYLWADFQKPPHPSGGDALLISDKPAVTLYDALDFRAHVLNAASVETSRGLRSAKKQNLKIDGAVALSFAVMAAG